jgi:prepilin-type N-terminal cleavage/methylation domain-containing protein
MKMKNNKGFTLVEVLAVITLAGVLVVLLIPVFQRAFGAAKQAIKDIDKQAITDGAKLYAEDLIHANKITTYDESGHKIVKTASYVTSTGTELSGYAFIEYAALNGMDVNVRYLADHGYYDKNCNYNEANNKCKVDPDCTVHISFEYEKIKANPECTLGDACKMYYSLGNYKATIVDETKCAIK